MVNVISLTSDSSIGTIWLLTSLQGNGLIYITDKFGRLVQQFSVEDSVLTIPLKNLANGVYQINVIADGKIVAMEKLVVAR